MKRIGYLYEKLIDTENLRSAIINASKGKTKRNSVQRVLGNIDFYVEDLRQRFEQLDFTSSYHMQDIVDGLSGKIRHLAIPDFYPDQCAHHAIVQVLRPHIEKSSYYWSGANIPGRGIKRAAIGVERATKRDIENAENACKFDIKQFYKSLKHKVIMRCLSRKIKDKRFLSVMHSLVESYHPGLPIGNYTSPWIAEWILQPIDKAIKGIVHRFVRYLDDFVLIDSSKELLHKALDVARAKLTELNLTIKENWQIFKIFNKGSGRRIDFVGRTFGIGNTRIRKYRALALMRQSRWIRRHKVIPFKIAAGFISRCSIFKFTDSEKMKEKYMNVIDFNKLKGVIRDESKRQQQSRAGACRTLSAA